MLARQPALHVRRVAAAPPASTRAALVRAAPLPAQQQHQQQADPQPAAVITGASSGIGQAGAVRLAQAGWRVFGGVRSPADAARLAEAHPGITPLRLDVCDETSIGDACSSVAAAVGERGVQLLVNNAGIGVVAPAEFFPLSEWRRVMEVNVLGVLAVTQAFLPLLRRGEARGRVVNVSSVAGHLPLPFWSAYTASKHALEALSDSLRYELKPQGIDVVLIKPGPVKTAIWDKATSSSKAIAEGLPPEAAALYGAQLQQMAAEVAESERTAIPVDDVAQLILQAATAPSPPSRLLIGTNAALLYWAKRLLPDSAWEGLVLQHLGRPYQPLALGTQQGRSAAVPAQQLGAPDQLQPSAVCSAAGCKR